MLSYDALLAHLRQLETELHQPETRRNPARLEQLLHPEFEEIGSSGRRYTRADVLREFAKAEQTPRIVAGEFRLRLLAPQVALVTYHSRHGEEGKPPNHDVRRASLWVHGEGGWRVMFHQATVVGEEGEGRR